MHVLFISPIFLKDARLDFTMREGIYHDATIRHQ